jgi:two-component system, NarL family, sensor kinase
MSELRNTSVRMAESFPGPRFQPAGGERWLPGAEEAERRSLARDLHDLLNQLAAIKLGLDEIEDQTQGGRDEIDWSRALVDGAIDEVRRISRDLYPAVLDNLGLPAAVRDLCGELQQRTGAQVDCAWDDWPGRLAGPAEMILYRVIRELLRNVERHARAGQVVVAGAGRDGLLAVQVRDDGCGFDPEQAEKAGLRGVRERIAFLSGRVSIQSAPGRGAEISIELPLVLLG